MIQRGRWKEDRRKRGTSSRGGRAIEFQLTKHRGWAAEASPPLSSARVDRRELARGVLLWPELRQARRSTDKTSPHATNELEHIAMEQAGRLSSLMSDGMSTLRARFCTSCSGSQMPRFVEG
jgi:hypothetical protein